MLTAILEEKLPRLQRGKTALGVTTEARLAQEIACADLFTEGCCHRRDVDVDFLRYASRTGMDGKTGAVAYDARLGAGALSHRQPLWTVRNDDARPLRNRVPRLGRWTDVGRLSLPL